MNQHQVIFLLILVAIAVFWVLGAYNRLVRLRNAIAAAFVPVEAQLVQRHEAVQKLTAAAAPYPPAIDPGAFDARFQRARAALEPARRQPGSPGAIAGLVRGEQELDEALAQLEGGLPLHRPPELRAALEGVSSLAAPFGFARQQFNAAVQAYNLAVKQAPTHLVAKWFGFGFSAEWPESPPPPALPEPEPSPS